MSKQMQNKCKELGYENCFEVGRYGLRRGLAMMWDTEVRMEVKSYSKHHIDTVVHYENGGYWRCTGIYGHPESRQKNHTWTLIKRLATLSSLPWLCFGDFNEIIKPSEKLGGNDRDVRMMLEFRNTMQECELMDLSWKGQ